MACCDLLLVRCRRLQRSAKCKYTHYRSTYCLVIRGADVTVWDSDPWKSRVWAFARKREITGEPLNSRSRILAPKWREITGVNCTGQSVLEYQGFFFSIFMFIILGRTSTWVVLTPTLIGAWASLTKGHYVFNAILTQTKTNWFDSITVVRIISCHIGPQYNMSLHIICTRPPSI